MTDVASDVVTGPLGDKAASALWQLSLALVFKMIVTVFTFGIKVCHVHCKHMTVDAIDICRMQHRACTELLLVRILANIG